MDVGIIAALATIAVATISVGGNILGEKLRYNREKKKKDKVKSLSPLDGIAQKAEFSLDAFKLMIHCEIDRVILFKATNGGGIINLVTPMYVTCLDECLSPGIESIKDKIQRWQTDSHYNRMLSNIIANGQVTFKIQEMEPCALKNIYLTSHLNEVSIHYLGAMNGRNQEVYYASFATKEHTGITDETKRDIELMINKYKVLVQDSIKEKQMSDE